MTTATVRTNFGGTVSTDGTFNNTYADGTLNYSLALLDTTGASTGITLKNLATFGVTGSSSNATAGVDIFQEDTLDYYLSIGTDETHQLELSGFAPNAAITLKGIGFQKNQASRDCDWIIDGQTIRYDNSGDAGAPTAPVSFTGLNADGNGKLIIEFGVVSSFAQCAAIEFIYTPVAVTADNSARFNSTINYVGNGLGTITTATLTDTKGNVLSLSSITDTTAVLPDYGAGQRCLTGAATLTVGDGTNTATTGVVVIPKSGYNSVGLEPGFTTTSGDWTYNWSGGQPTNDTEAQWTHATTTLMGDGSVTGVTAIHTLQVWVTDPSDGFMSELTLEFTANGELILPVGGASAEAFGSPALLVAADITPLSILSTEAFGNTTVDTPAPTGDAIYGVRFDSASAQWFSSTDHADWDIIRSNGSQYLAFWMEMEENVGTLFQYFFSTGNFRSVNKHNIFINETSAGADPDAFRSVVGATAQDITSTAQTIPTGKILVIWEYNSTTLDQELIVCSEGGSATRYVATTNMSADLFSDVHDLGRRADADTDRYFNNIIYNVAKGTGHLTNANVETLAASLVDYDRTLLDTVSTAEIFFPMNEGTGTTLTDDILSLSYTGTNFPDDTHWVLVQAASTPTIAPPGIASEEAFGTPTLATGSVSISPSGIVSTEAFGTTTVTLDAVTLLPVGIASEEAFGATSVNVGAVTLTPSGIASQEAFGTAALSTGAVSVSPNGIASAELFGTAVISTDAVVIAPTGIASQELFGSVVVTNGAVNILPNGIASSEAFGTAVLSTGGTTVLAIGIASSEAFGTAKLALNLTPSSIGSEEVFGTASISIGAATIQPEGIGSGETFGTPTLHMNINAVGIPSEEAFGTSVISEGSIIRPTGIVSAEAFGNAAIDNEKLIKIDFEDQVVLTTNLGSTTVYYNGRNYFTI